MNNDLGNKANASTLSNYLPKSNGITSIVTNGSSYNLKFGNGTSSNLALPNIPTVKLASNIPTSKITSFNNSVSAIKVKNSSTSDWSTNSDTANYAKRAGSADNASNATLINNTFTITATTYNGSYGGKVTFTSAIYYSKGIFMGVLNGNPFAVLFNPFPSYSLSLYPSNLKINTSGMDLDFTFYPVGTSASGAGTFLNLEVNNNIP